MALLSRFQTKLKRASVGGILADRPVDMSDRPTQEELIEMATAEDQGKIELDVEDLATDNWLVYFFRSSLQNTGSVSLFLKVFINFVNTIFENWSKKVAKI